MNIINTLLPSLPPQLKYIIALCAILLLILLFKYISNLLQAATEWLLSKKNFIAKGWLSLMAKYKLFSNIFFAFAMSILSPACGIFFGDLYPNISLVVVRVVNCLVIVAFTLVLNSALSVISDKFSRSIKLPVKGIIQAVKVIMWIITIIFMMSALMNKEPIYFLGGLTALSAVILLIFKDSILGLTSGFQLLLNDLVRVGDWIEIPSQGADGEVIDILLTTIRVRNWDNTIVNVPAYDLVAHSFTNWRGMTESGGRRIKRAINIDMKSIRFLTEEDIEKLKHINLLKDYLAKKEKEIEEINKKRGVKDDKYNAKRLSNIGTFRMYCYNYLKQNPNISDKFTCMVRQLAPTTEGLPLEIYAFSSNTNWTDYEGIQADIFDHFLSIIDIFDLKVYQRYGMD